jgi:hypothetical protein
MSDWVDRLFIERSEIFLKLVDERWQRTEESANTIVKMFEGYGIIHLETVVELFNYERDSRRLC